MECIEKGIKESKLEIAEKLLDNGHSIEYVSEITELQETEIRNLK